MKLRVRVVSLVEINILGRILFFWLSESVLFRRSPYYLKILTLLERTPVAVSSRKSRNRVCDYSAVRVKLYSVFGRSDRHACDLMGKTRSFYYFFPRRKRDSLWRHIFHRVTLAPYIYIYMYILLIHAASPVYRIVLIDGRNVTSSQSCAIYFCSFHSVKLFSVRNLHLLRV